MVRLEVKVREVSGTVEARVRNLDFLPVTPDCWKRVMQRRDVTLCICLGLFKKQIPRWD